MKKQGYIFVADMYYVVRPVIVVSVLNMYRHFLFCHHSLNNTTTFMAFTLYSVLYKSREDIPRLYVNAMPPLYTGLGHPWVLLLTGVLEPTSAGTEE